jgi:hypothetical protein
MGIRLSIHHLIHFWFWFFCCQSMPFKSPERAFEGAKLYRGFLGKCPPAVGGRALVQINLPRLCCKCYIACATPFRFFSSTRQGRPLSRSFKECVFWAGGYGVKVKMAPAQGPVVSSFRFRDLFPRLLCRGGSG